MDASENVSRRRRRRRELREAPEVKEVEAPEVVEKEPEKVVEVEEAETTQPQGRTPRRRGSVDVKTEPDPAVTVKPNPLEDLMLLMEEGQKLVITRVGATWHVSSLATELVSGKGVKKGRLPGDYWEKILTDEYYKWQQGEWGAMTYEEKIAYAKELGAEWEPHEHMQTEMMRVVPAVREILGIEKYKPQYATEAQRAEAKERARAGLDY